jgi:hypothetical protein
MLAIWDGAPAGIGYERQAHLMLADRACQLKISRAGLPFLLALNR